MRSVFIKFILFYLRFFAKTALLLSKTTVIGIGGSIGKTSTKNALFSVLKEHFQTKYTSGNSETGVPLGILGVPLQGSSVWTWAKIMLCAPFQVTNLRKTQYLIVEMGTDDPFPPKNMEYLLKIVKPDIALFLNTSSAHTMQFEKALNEEEKKLTGSQKTDAILKKMASEDGKIITKSCCLSGIYCSDNRYVNEEITLFREKSKTTKLYSYGENKKNDISYETYDVDLEKTVFTFETPKGTIHINFKNYVLPLEYREVFGATIMTALLCGLSLKEIQTSLEKNFTLPKGRASIFKGINNSIIFDSSYNASRMAVEAFLSLVATLKKQTKRPVIFIFGDMKELGSQEQEEHRVLAEKISETVDYLYCTGPLTKKYLLPALKKNILQETRWFENSIVLGEYVAKKMPKNALILVKGSQNNIFLEEAIKPLLQDASDQENLCRQEQFWKQQKTA